MKKLNLSCGDFLIFVACLFTFLFSLAPPYLDFRLHDNVGINLQRFLVVIAFIVFFIFLFLSRGLVRSFLVMVSANRLALGLFVFYLFLRLASCFEEMRLYSFFLLVNELLMNFFVLIFFASVVTSISDVRRVIFYTLSAAFLVAVLVFFEVAIEGNFFSSLANTSTTAGGVAAEVKYRDGLYRAQGTFEHPLALAQYFLVLTPLLFSRLIFGGARFWSVMMVVVFIMAVYFARVRTFYVALSIGLLFYLCMFFLWGGNFRMRGNTRLGLILLCIPFVLLFGAYKIYALLFLGSGAEVSSTMVRFSQLYNGVIAIIESPFLGYGVGRAEEIIVHIGIHHPNGLPIWNEAIDNYYLSLALDSGLPALLLFVAFLMVSIASGVLVYRNKDNPLDIRWVALSLSTSIVCAAVSMMVLSIFTVLPVVFMLVGLSFSLLAISHRIN
nr:O-antigen ligase family protein [Pseudomonas oleovorans]